MVGALYRKEIEAKMEVERASSPELDPTDPSDANKIKVNIVILILDGHSETGAHVGSEIGKLPV